jgi:hypothetical protein
MKAPHNTDYNFIPSESVNEMNNLIAQTEAKLQSIIEELEKYPDVEKMPNGDQHGYASSFRIMHEFKTSLEATLKTWKNYVS